MSRNIPESIAVVLLLWPELPHLAGREWPHLYWRLMDLLRAWEEAGEEEDRAAISLRLLEIVRQWPQGRRALREVLAGQLRVTRGGDLSLTEEAGAVPADDAALAARLEELLHPPSVTRYTDIYAPSRTVVGERFPIIVGLTRSPSEEEETTVIQARLNELLRVVLTPRGPQLLGEPTRTLRVEEGESEPVVFYLRAVSAGTQSVLIDFYSRSHLLASVTHTLTAEEAGIMPPPGRLPAQRIDLRDYNVPHPGLVLRVSTKENRLLYTLNYADATQRVIYGGTLRADPEKYRYQILREIENLARGLDADGAPLDPDTSLSSQAFFKRLERIGYRLYDELFSEDLRREYREHIRGRVCTLEVISDEPWIPWELVKPYDANWADDFLCLQYDFSRWVDNGQAPAAEIRVESLVCVAPDDQGLPFARMEKEAVRSIARDFGLTDRTPTRAGRAEVEALIEGEVPVHLWHFACHGDFDAEAPGNSPLVLEQGQRLRPNDLAGPEVKRRLNTDRPLVFLNACRVGQGGLSLTGLGGWAARLVGECRVGALIAPLWAVNDQIAFEFARAFYKATHAPGMTLAAAVRRARQQVRESYPDDPTWLAYSLYAHPNARLVWNRVTPAGL